MCKKKKDRIVYIGKHLYECELKLNFSVKLTFKCVYFLGKLTYEDKSYKFYSLVKIRAQINLVKSS